ncbi:hypothetical protein V5O48_006332 [Marasmius crinis-equi]|uniref:Uncharacterized protein n=1 Tax=Marasmius crinis-equi TaxID=585013 RepID=A0ABR3FJT5_9AGAR
MGFFDDIVVRPNQERAVAQATRSETRASELSSSSSDAQGSASGTPSRSSGSTTELSFGSSSHTTPLAGRSLQRHGAFDRITSEGYPSPTPPRLPATFSHLKRRWEGQEDTPRTKVCIQEHADKVCESHDLDNDGRAQVKKFAELPEREGNITLYGELMSLRSSLQEQRNTNGAKLLLDKGFKSELTDQMTVCILSPDLTAYVTAGTVEAIMKLINAHPAYFRIPKTILDSQTQFKALASLVTKCLALILKSIKPNKVDGPDSLSFLCKHLAVSGMEVKGNMWACVAFLRLCVVEFKKELARATSDVASMEEASSTMSSTKASSRSFDGPAKIYTKDQFWKYVDDQLGEARREALKHGKSRIGQQQQLSEFFQKILANDLAKYPGKFMGPTVDNTPITLPWQQIYEKAMYF